MFLGHISLDHLLIIQGHHTNVYNLYQLYHLYFYQDYLTGFN